LRNEREEVWGLPPKNTSGSSKKGNNVPEEFVGEKWGGPKLTGKGTGIRKCTRGGAVGKMATQYTRSFPVQRVLGGRQMGGEEMGGEKHFKAPRSEAEKKPNEGGERGWKKRGVGKKKNWLPKSRNRKGKKRRRETKKVAVPTVGKELGDIEKNLERVAFFVKKKTVLGRIT